MPDDYNLLGLGEYTSLVKNVTVSSWGSEVRIECLYNPIERSPYVLVFRDCRDIKWTVHDEEEVGEPFADLIGIHLGEDAHRQPALIHTDIFEISILYGSFSVEKGKGDEYNNPSTAAEPTVEYVGGTVEVK